MYSEVYWAHNILFLGGALGPIRGGKNKKKKKSCLAGEMFIVTLII